MMNRDKQPERERPPREFRSIPFPADLLKVKMRLVQAELKKRPEFANRLATNEDLSYIKENPDHFDADHPLKDGNVHYAFENATTIGGVLCIPGVEWALDNEFDRTGRLLEHSSVRSGRILLRV